MAVASRARVVVMCALAVLAGCGGGTGSSSPTDVADSNESLPTSTTPSTTTPSTPVTTDVVATTDGVDTTVASTEPGALGLSPDGPWRLVDSAPGVEGVGLVYELMPKLWVFLPTEVDLERGYLWTFNEQDRPIIEAYLMAVLTLYRSIDSVPATLDDPGWDLYYTPELRARVVPQFQERSDLGTYLDLDLGVVLRPRVVADMTTSESAVVLDCSMDGAVQRNLDGSYAEGATPGIVESGYANAMVFVAGEWRLDAYESEAAACAAG